ncbi:MAG: aminomethyl-transferring glycine dehydrogenase [Fidelibacterota bacterium]
MSKSFYHRHIGSDSDMISHMLNTIGCASLDDLINETVPDAIRRSHPLNWPAVPEHRALRELHDIAGKNKVLDTYIGQGFYDTILPGVIRRNIQENPGWYTQYTPYQAEISQGRLEALLNFQTMVIDLTALDIANASLLDEATAAAEAMNMLYQAQRSRRKKFFVDHGVFSQTAAVLQTRANPLDIELVFGSALTDNIDDTFFGVLVQYPNRHGDISDYRDLCHRVHTAGGHVVVAADLLALTLLVPPGEFGADVAVGTSQRFGVPLGYGGPHAAYFATRDAFRRRLPGRIIGVSIDSQGQPALRMALQTREQHIRREKATSNICTAQVLLAIMAGMYAVYHGPQGLKDIARHIRRHTFALAQALKKNGHTVLNGEFFDTLHIRPVGLSIAMLRQKAEAASINLAYSEDSVGISLGESIDATKLQALLDLFNISRFTFPEEQDYPESLQRTSSFLIHPVFNSYHTETEMLRYIRRLEMKDLSLTTSMIPLGSCTMKLNATSEMIPIMWPEFSDLHPFIPRSQAEGYHIMIRQLEHWLSEITGFSAVSLQPNSGAQGEYSGLMVIRACHRAQDNGNRRICLIPASAHGTNPASATMAGMEVVIVACDDGGNIDLEDLRSKAGKYANRLAAFMVTYPSTHGVFEPGIREACQIIHEHGGLVYLDGANLNAMVGLCEPAAFGADIMHINLHKTFAIPHGGGGPGMGPICTTETLAPFLPGHPVVRVGGDQAMTAVAAAPWGSASILAISWMYIALMGGEGLTEASAMAILNANYMAARLQEYFPILYTGENGRVAHEFIVDLRPFKKETGITEEDVAKRLMDYGFHAPTMSFPVPGTLMIEPTESESKAELDRFCDAMIAIRNEILQVKAGKLDQKDNPLKNAPHTAAMVTADTWSHPYSREQAAYPVPALTQFKFWPVVGRVNNAYGDRNLVCSCPPVDTYRTN